jgi:hypothetical protein
MVDEDDFFFTPEGQPQMLDAAGQSITASAYDWRWLFRVGRHDGQGIYRVGSGEWDYLTGGPLEHSAESYWNEQLPLKPPSLSAYEKVVLAGAAPVAGIAGFVVGGPPGAFLAYAGVRGFQGGFERYADGQGWAGAIQGGVSDGTMWTDLYGAWKNRDPITGEGRGWSTGQRWLHGGVAVLNIAAPWFHPLGNGLRAAGGALSEGSLMVSGGSVALSRGFALAGAEAAAFGGQIGALGPAASLAGLAGNTLFSITENDRTANAAFGQGSGVQIKSPRQIAAEADRKEYHHIFLQYRGFQRFLGRYVRDAEAFDFHAYTVPITRAQQQVLHSSRNVLYRMFGYRGGWWEMEMRNAIKDRFADFGRQLTHEELVEVGRQVAASKGLPTTFVPYPH